MRSSTSATSRAWSNVLASWRARCSARFRSSAALKYFYGWAVAAARLLALSGGGEGAADYSFGGEGVEAAVDFLSLSRRST